MTDKPENTDNGNGKISWLRQDMLDIKRDLNELKISFNNYELKMIETCSEKHGILDKQIGTINLKIAIASGFLFVVFTAASKVFIEWGMGIIQKIAKLI